MATRCYILRLKCTKFDSSSAPSGSLAGFKGPLLLRGGKEENGGEKGSGRFTSLDFGDGHPCLAGGLKLQQLDVI